jgi:hypothetical protein
MKTRTIMLALAAALAGTTYSLDATAHDEPVVGVIGGAAAGALVAGPPGAVAGAVIGGITGAAVAHDNDHGHRHGHHHARLYRSEPVRYMAPARHVESSAYCEPQRTYYRSSTVYREPLPKYTKVAAAQPKLKKVCRYERVRTVNTASAATRRVG